MRNKEREREKKKKKIREVDLASLFTANATKELKLGNQKYENEREAIIYRKLGRLYRLVKIACTKLEHVTV